MKFLMTDMSNEHTCTIGSLDLMLSYVSLLYSELIKITSDVIHGSSVSVPICIHGIGLSCGSSYHTVIFSLIRMVEAMIALKCYMLSLAVHLTCGTMATPTVVLVLSTPSIA